MISPLPTSNFPPSVHAITPLPHHDLPLTYDTINIHTDTIKTQLHAHQR
jgi:hypothetical protein